MEERNDVSRPEFFCFGSFRIWRSMGRNRLVAGFPRNEEARWAEFFESIGFRRIVRKQENGFALELWVHRVYPPETREALLHTDMLIETIAQMSQGNIQAFAWRVTS